MDGRIELVLLIILYLEIIMLVFLKSDNINLEFKYSN